MLIWHIISEETRAKLKSMMSKSWQPPAEDNKPFTKDLAMESSEEIARLMAIPTHFDKEPK